MASTLVAMASSLLAMASTVFHRSSDGLQLVAKASTLVSTLVTKGSLSYLSSPCFSKNVLQSGVGIVH